ncbi:MAG: acetylxylan esterase [Anaerolineales bacterium]|nr:acetylxylan esterase [Anaerolineales bacterium]
MSIDQLRQEISEFLEFSISDAPVHYVTHETIQEDGYQRFRISYPSQEGDQIPAFLLLPDGRDQFAAVLVHHQHNSQRHLGKSEVCGLVGDTLQAFGPALAQQGIVVLAPDSICFEDRRHNITGIEPDDADVEQHYNEMCYRLLRGDTLMHKVLSDSAQAISLLSSHSQVDPQRIGILGHSYGGNTVLFHGAVDERIRFACASGAACTYQYKMAHQLGIEMAEVIPGFVTRYDIPDLIACFAPRRILIASATNDKASQDANKIVNESQEICASEGVIAHLEHQRDIGGHALTQERFYRILQWITECAA